MTLEKLYTILKATGFPVAYSHFEVKTSLPFITYLVDGKIGRASCRERVSERV